MRANLPRTVLPHVSSPFVVLAVPLFPFCVLLPAAAVCVPPVRPEAALAVLLVSRLTFSGTCQQSDLIICIRLARAVVVQHAEVLPSWRHYFTLCSHPFTTTD